MKLFINYINNFKVYFANFKFLFKAFGAVACYHSWSYIAGIQQLNDTIDENGDAEGAYATVAMIKDNSPLGWTVKETGIFSKTGNTFIKLVISL